MKGARINFGIPDSEYILKVDDTGAATSLVRQDANTEYVGGNPNSVQVITGTLENPFGDVDLEELFDGLYRGSDDNGNAHAVIRANPSVLGFGMITQPLFAIDSNFRSTGADIGVDSSLADNFLWSFVDGTLVDAKNGAGWNYYGHKRICAPHSHHAHHLLASYAGRIKEQ